MRFQRSAQEKWRNVHTHTVHTHTHTYTHTDESCQNAQSMWKKGVRGKEENDSARKREGMHITDTKVNSF